MQNKIKVFTSHILFLWELGSLFNGLILVINKDIIALKSLHIIIVEIPHYF